MLQLDLVAVREYSRLKESEQSTFVYETHQTIQWFFFDIKWLQFRTLAAHLYCNA